MNKIIEISGLSKSFKKIRAVQDLSFSVERGSLFAFLGVNGAGKSTTISMMCGQLRPDSGSIFIDGVNIAENAETVKATIGVVYQGSVLDKPLSVYDNLKCRAALYGIFGEAFETRALELCELLDMSDILNRPYGKLSGGQRRKADIARALLHKPKLLILDEPTTGLDPQTRRIVWDVIKCLMHNDDMTVFLTTHYMEEAADADQVVILDSGRIVAQGTPVELKNKYTVDYIIIYGKSEEEVASVGIPYEKVVDGYRLRVQNTADATGLIASAPELFSDYEIVKGKMDDVFICATGKSLGEDDNYQKKGGKRQ